MPQDVDPGCDVVLSPEEYSEFQQMLARPPRVLPALVRLFKIQRLKGEADTYRALAAKEGERAGALMAAVTVTQARIAEVEAELVELRAAAEAGKQYPGDDDRNF